MNGFFTDPLFVTNLLLCVHIRPGMGQRAHKNRPSHGLVCQLSGHTRYVFEGEAPLEVHAGDVYYLPKFSNYTVEWLEPGECIAVNFELSQSQRTYPAFRQQWNGEGQFRELLRHWNSRKPGDLPRCCAILYAILSDVQQNAAKGYLPSPVRSQAAFAAAYLREHLSDPTLTVQQVSSLLGISPEYFRKRFRSVLGSSPRQYLMEARMEKARELLLSREFSVGTVSRLCGYENESYFSSEFRRLVGCTPTEYGGEWREMTGTIHKLDVADYEKCGNIWNMAAFPLTETFRQQIADGIRTVFVYEENGAFLGEIAFVQEMNDPDYTIPGRRVYLSRLIVKPEARRQGIGSALIDRVLQEVRALGYSEASIGVDKDNAAALALYRKKGFTTVLFDGEDEDGAYYKLMRML